MDPKIIPLVLALVKLIKDNKDLVFKMLDNVAGKTPNEVDDEVVAALATLFGVELPSKEALEEIAEKLEVAQTKYDNKKETGAKLAESESLIETANELDEILGDEE